MKSSITPTLAHPLMSNFFNSEEEPVLTHWLHHGFVCEWIQNTNNSTTYSCPPSPRKEEINSVCTYMHVSVSVYVCVCVCVCMCMFVCLHCMKRRTSFALKLLQLSLQLCCSPLFYPFLGSLFAFPSFPLCLSPSFNFCLLLSMFPPPISFSPHFPPTSQSLPLLLMSS